MINKCIIQNYIYDYYGKTIWSRHFTRHFSVRHFSVPPSPSFDFGIGRLFSVRHFSVSYFTCSTYYCKLFSVYFCSFKCLLFFPKFFSSYTKLQLLAKFSIWIMSIYLKFEILQLIFYFTQVKNHMIQVLQYNAIYEQFNNKQQIKLKSQRLEFSRVSFSLKDKVPYKIFPLKYNTIQQEVTLASPLTNT